MIYHVRHVVAPYQINAPFAALQTEETLIQKTNVFVNLEQLIRAKEFAKVVITVALLVVM